MGLKPRAQRPVTGALVGKPPALFAHMHIELILADVDPGHHGCHIPVLLFLR